MATRAIQDPLQILGFRDPTTDVVLALGTVEFYAAGTTTPKSAWEDKDKVTAVTSVTLDSAGQAQLYFDGVYKFIVKNAAGTTRITLDDLKYQARNTSTLTKSADYQCTSDDDYILVNTDGGAVTITLAAVAGVVAPINIKNIGTSANSVTVDGSGSETIDGGLTATLLDGVAQQYVTDGIKWYGTVSSGVTYTSATLVSGTNNSFDASAGITTVNVPDASNTTKGAIEIATDAEATTGTSEILATNPKQLAAEIATAIALIGLQVTYTSTAQTITTGGQLVLAHSLALEPKIVTYTLQCLAGDAGYSIGDRIMIPFNSSDGSGRHSTPLIDATNITIRFSNTTQVFTCGNKGTGANTLLTNTSWALYVSAWA